MDSSIRAAVEAYCTPENLERVVTVAASSALDRVIKEEVEKFFLFGDGRQAVRIAVEERLAKGSAGSQVYPVSLLDRLHETLESLELPQPRWSGTMPRFLNDSIHLEDDWYTAQQLAWSLRELLRHQLGRGGTSAG